MNAEFSRLKIELVAADLLWRARRTVAPVGEAAALPVAVELTLEVTKVVCPRSEPSVSRPEDESKDAELDDPEDELPVVFSPAGTCVGSTSLGMATEPTYIPGGRVPEGDKEVSGPVDESVSVGAPGNDCTPGS